MTDACSTLPASTPTSPVESSSSVELGIKPVDTVDYGADGPKRRRSRRSAVAAVGRWRVQVRAVPTGRARAISCGSVEPEDPDSFERMASGGPCRTDTG